MTDHTLKPLDSVLDFESYPNNTLDTTLGYHSGYNPKSPKKKMLFFGFSGCTLNTWNYTPNYTLGYNGGYDLGYNDTSYLHFTEYNPNSCTKPRTH